MAKMENDWYFTNEWRYSDEFCKHVARMISNDGVQKEIVLIILEKCLNYYNYGIY